MAYTADLYDTPDGHLDPGYTLDTSDSETGPGIAHDIGTQSWADCNGADGNTYEIKISAGEYNALSGMGAVMPQETLDLSDTDAYTVVGGNSSNASSSPQSSSPENSTVDTDTTSLDSDSSAIATSTATSTTDDDTATSTVTTSSDDIDSAVAATSTDDTETTTVDAIATSSPD